MTSEQINAAVAKTLDMFRSLSEHAKEQNLFLDFEQSGAVVHYPKRIINSRQTYSLYDLISMAMIAVVADKKFSVCINATAGENFLQPFVEFEGTEPKLDDVFVALNDSLDKFIADNPIDGLKCGWRYAPDPGINDDRSSAPFALLSNIYANGAFTDIRFTRDFLFFFVLSDAIRYSEKHRVREGSTESYSYIGLPDELHSGYHEAMKEILEKVQKAILEDAFKKQYSVQPKTEVRSDVQ
ncbi:hypothetical protein JA33_038 [Dickeya phage vB_DsoM_JA33]|uniref:Uncharacterized protein n=2 Tax=Salmondvirus JA11 TaxID=2734141 RepID=A0A386K656_9CAUD|nr:hypothetical protein HOU32_gp038 [Dickeya phage vB_DsoM_JA11]AXG67412.1 hypothetical protein JA33_038 [Dickeya phage vB_DsoM_JA33]AYD79843.1 hypothetical protein JA11_038 [Dickeya phage vB_DsoM_JA11]